jgi:transcriptional regulator with XRE-family HTH domain
MPSTLRLAVGAWCRRTRIELDITQQQLADALGISRTYLVAIEAGRANPSLALVDRMGDALDTTFELIANGPKLIGGTRERDLIHARCSGYVGRRLKAAGLDVAREVGIIDGRSRGWIDLLAFDRRTGTMLIVEIKTELDDVGRIERQLGWYERVAWWTDEARTWRPRRVQSWLLVLATAQADAAIARQRDALTAAFPARARERRLDLAGRQAPPGSSRGLALIDPRRRGREWLIPSRADGRRSPAPYPDRPAALRALS